VRRRDFIKVIAGSTAVWSLAARAQQPTMPVVGYLDATSSLAKHAPFAAVFRNGLNDVGFVEGNNVAIEYRRAEGHYDRLPALAAELVRRPATVIVAVGPPACALAAKAATTSISIVFLTGGDPIALGLVRSLNRPGGNVTGVSLFNVALVPKQLELVRDLVPNARVIAAIVNPDNPNTEAEERELNAAAQALGLVVHVLRASSENEVTAAFATIVQQGAGAVIVSFDAFFLSRNDQFVALAARHSLPAIYHWREFAESGGLMAYGTNLVDAYRQTGIYTGKILQGARPVDLPVWRQTKFELVINLKTAKALGLTVPPTLLTRADEVIE
jgi:putative tryptophan/tyrosine transport system substrate-binding protein